MLLGQSILSLWIKKIQRNEPLPFLGRLVPYLSPAIEKIGDFRRFAFKAFYVVSHNVEDHEQSSSDQIPSVGCVHRSPAHVLEKVDGFGVCYISNDCACYEVKGRHIHWHRMRTNSNRHR